MTPSETLYHSLRFWRTSYLGAYFIVFLFNSMNKWIYGTRLFIITGTTAQCMCQLYNSLLYSFLMSVEFRPV